MIIIFVFRYFISGIQFLIISLFNLVKWFVLGIFTTIIIFPYYFGLGIYYLVNKERRNNIGLNKPVIPTIMIILSLTTYFISIFLFTRWLVQSERIKKMSQSIIESTVILENVEEEILANGGTTDGVALENNYNSENSFGNSSFSVNFNYWVSRNSDTVAWLNVPSTNINYPVVQSDDNEFYLEHDINKYSTNVGWIFGDYRSNFNDFEKNTIIYGHNLTNKTMFGSLPKILRSSWYKKENNHYITMYTNNTTVVWKVFSVYKIEPVTDYLRTTFYSEQEYLEWLSLMKNRSIYDFGEFINSDDRILTLSTCDDTGNKRVVLQAKLVSFNKN